METFHSLCTLVRSCNSEISGSVGHYPRRHCCDVAWPNIAKVETEMSSYFTGSSLIYIKILTAKYITFSWSGSLGNHEWIYIYKQFPLFPL